MSDSPGWMRSVVGLAATLLCVSPTIAKSDPGEPTQVRFENSCAPGAQAEFAHAVTLLQVAPPGLVVQVPLNRLFQAFR